MLGRSPRRGGESPGLYQGGNVNTEAGMNDGDVIAFSGPVPYSYGYGAPVV
jgi:hypothetical protein